MNGDRLEEVPSRTSFPGKVGLQQRVMPAYRVPFFDRLAEACMGGLNVFAGAPRPGEAILPSARLETAGRTEARNVHLFRGVFYLCFQPGILEWLERWDPEVLLLEANPRYVSNIRAITWMHERRRAIVGWGLGARIGRGVLGPGRDWVRRRYLRRFDAIIAYSSLGAEQYRHAGVPEQQIFVAPNAVAPSKPVYTVRDSAEGRAARVLFVGRLQVRKRIDMLLRACAAMDPQPELTIVGDGPARMDLERAARDLFPQTNFTGALHGAALKPIFQQSDLFVLPGTGGLAVQEAMAQSLPVIVAEGDGTQNDLVSGGNGWLIPPGDLHALMDALREALANPERLLEMGRKSHKLVEQRFNIDAMADVFVKVLNTVAGRV
jgi:glycosyltransferase involved in cell wall biosynthesis